MVHRQPRRGDAAVPGTPAFNEAPTVRFVRDRSMIEEVYEPRVEPFVAPPWRLRDWTWAVVAGLGGVFTALVVFVLLSTTQLAADNARFAPAALAVASRVPRTGAPDAEAPRKARRAEQQDAQKADADLERAERRVRRAARAR